jgi:hypothetical protein
VAVSTQISQLNRHFIDQFWNGNAVGRSGEISCQTLPVDDKTRTIGSSFCDCSELLIGTDETFLRFVVSPWVHLTALREGFINQDFTNHRDESDCIFVQNCVFSDISLADGSGGALYISTTSPLAHFIILCTFLRSAAQQMVERLRVLPHRL